MKNLVIVKSKTINNEAVPVVFRTVEVLQAGVATERELSRSYVFKNFQAEIPLRLAKLLIKQNPGEFSIIGATDKEPTKEVKEAIRVSKEKRKGFTCPHCGAEAKSKAGLTAHIRYNHPNKWEGKKTIKTK